jgi:uncharacterized repeat protein (TIGR01451 family)
MLARIVLGMKKLPRFRILLWLAVGLMTGSLRTEAQGYGLSVSSSVSAIQVSNLLTYSINVTTLVGSSNAQLTNALPASVQIISVSAVPNQVSYTTNGSVVLFNLGVFAPGGLAQLTVTAEPTVAGFITNTVTVASTYITNTATTNVVVLVTNAVPPEADLGVAIVGPVQTVITNDFMTYTISVTNLGPRDAAGVLLTNTLPPGVILIGVNPTNQTYTVASSNLVFNLGTLNNGGYEYFQFTVQPTNIGVFSFAAAIGTSAVVDTNIDNNTASTNIDVVGYSPGTLVAVTNSGQTINLQNGLTEQSIMLTNTGTNDVAAARVLVTGMARQLYNAVGTNNGNPFVYYSAPLAASSSVSLLLQYNPRGFFPFTNGQLQAYAVSLPNWTPPIAISTSTNLYLSRIVELTNGNQLIEWPAVTNRTYTVVYSDNILFSNAMIAPPSIIAPANRVQWIDYGPPTTVKAPANASARYYRVFLNP